MKIISKEMLFDAHFLKIYRRLHFNHLRHRLYVFNSYVFWFKQRIHNNWMRRNSYNKWLNTKSQWWIYQNDRQITTPCNGTWIKERWEMNIQTSPCNSISRKVKVSSTLLDYILQPSSHIIHTSPLNNSNVF